VEVEPTVNLALHDFGYGSTVLLMQGWPFDSTVWEPLPVLLADGHRVVTYDPRGLGSSDRPWEFYSVEMQAADLHRLVVETALRDITLVAWSSAALPALLYAREHRARIERLLLLNPLLPSWLANEALMEELHLHPELDAQAQESWGRTLLRDRATLHERLLDHLTHTPLSGPGRHWLWQRLMAGAQHAQVKNWEALRLTDPYLDGFPPDLPITIVVGEQDRLSPPVLGMHLASRLPRTRYLTLPDAGHASFLDQCDAVEGLIRDAVLHGEQESDAAEEPVNMPEEHAAPDEDAPSRSLAAPEEPVDMPAEIATSDEDPPSLSPAAPEDPVDARSRLPS
jgi:pimeloyl-ACP methyl ester carboxylesterase